MEDLNYLLHREQQELMNVDASQDISARRTHQALAEGYAQRIRDHSHPYRSPQPGHAGTFDPAPFGVPAPGEGMQPVEAPVARRVPAPRRSGNKSELTHCYEQITRLEKLKLTEPLENVRRTYDSALTAWGRRIALIEATIAGRQR